MSNVKCPTTQQRTAQLHNAERNYGGVAYFGNICLLAQQSRSVNAISSLAPTSTNGQPTSSLTQIVINAGTLYKEFVLQPLRLQRLSLLRR